MRLRVCNISIPCDRTINLISPRSDRACWGSDSLRIEVQRFLADVFFWACICSSGTVFDWLLCKVLCVWLLRTLFLPVCSLLSKVPSFLCLVLTMLFWVLCWFACWATFLRATLLMRWLFSCSFRGFGGSFRRVGPACWLLVGTIFGRVLTWLLCWVFVVLSSLGSLGFTSLFQLSRRKVKTKRVAKLSLKKSGWGSGYCNGLERSGARLGSGRSGWTSQPLLSCEFGEGVVITLKIFWEGEEWKNLVEPLQFL